MSEKIETWIDLEKLDQEALRQLRKAVDDAPDDISRARAKRYLRQFLQALEA